MPARRTLRAERSEISEPILNENAHRGTGVIGELLPAETALRVRRSKCRARLGAKKLRVELKRVDVLTMMLPFQRVFTRNTGDVTKLSLGQVHVPRYDRGEICTVADSLMP